MGADHAITPVPEPTFVVKPCISQISRCTASRRQIFSRRWSVRRCRDAVSIGIPRLEVDQELLRGLIGIGVQALKHFCPMSLGMGRDVGGRAVS